MQNEDRILVSREFVGLWKGLNDTEARRMLTQNIPPEMLPFFIEHAPTFAGVEPKDRTETLGMANCLVAGYLLRVLEERI